MYSPVPLSLPLQPDGQSTQRAKLTTPWLESLQLCLAAGTLQGTLVREVDALGGLMAVAADQAGIHFRLLNRSKGPAVQGPRAQTDRVLYKHAMVEAVRSVSGLHVLDGAVVDLLINPVTAIDAAGDAQGPELYPSIQDATAGEVAGVRLENGQELRANRVILTTGTFLRGVLHIGRKRRVAGE